MNQFGFPLYVDIMGALHYIITGEVDESVFVWCSVCGITFDKKRSKENTDHQAK